MSFFKKFAEKIPEGIKHARDEVIGTWNPDRRHDEPHEQEMDRVRQEIRDSHRFNSFAEQRTNNCVKWHVDGRDYMWALSEFLESAKEAIFILDWWLSPELYLRRPPEHHQQWRLDRVLKRKAEQGVKIYVVVYKEVTQTMSMSSSYTKHYLEDLHPNIVCLRHPDHIGSKDSVQFWSHHEKVVVVDNHFACIGGLDLCYGRWDLQTHPLADVHPTDWNKTLFPGQDYNNARIMDFKDVNQFASNTLSILENARMPWHDVHMTLTGPVVLDIVQHFVERWNEIKKRKYRNDDRVDWLALPHDVQAAPNEAVARHPERETWHDKGHRFKNRWHRVMGGEDEQEEEHERRAYRRESLPNDSWGFTCNVQVCRSVSDWSHGVLTEHSIQNAYIKLIQDSEHHIYIENQFFISATKDGEQIVNQIARALVDRIIRAHSEGAKFKVVIAIPEVPGFAGQVKDESSLQFIMAGQYRTINRGGSSIYECLWREGIEPLDYIRFYHLRAYDRINAPWDSYIKKAEEASGVTFHEASVAMARQWIGDNSKQKEVKFLIPKETKEGLVEGPKTKGEEDIVTVKMPESEQEAEATLRRFEEGAKAVRGDEDVADNVVQHMLMDKTHLRDEKWLGTEEEELNAYVSELLYIHSKLMIVDDRRVIMGSANINDRSQKGDGDSEIALVVEDTEMIPSRMDGQEYQASKFAATLRRKLYREHLGLIPPQHAQPHNDKATSFMTPAPNPYDFAEEFDGDRRRLREAEEKVLDPLSDKTINFMIQTAHTNREMFEDIFRCVPSDKVRNWKAYDEYVPKIKKNHVAPGNDLARVKEKLSRIQGALVESPLNFLIDEKTFVQGPAWDGLNPTLPIYI